MVLVSHPSGNENVSAVVSGLFERDLLSAYCTCILWRPENLLARIVPGRLRAILERRSKVQLPPELVRTRPLREILRNLLLKVGQGRGIKGEDNPISVDGVYRDLDRYVAGILPRMQRSDANLRGVYAYEDGALHQFRVAAKLGIHRVYDLPISYWRTNHAFSREEAELKPAWRGTLKALTDGPRKCARKDEELALADTIVVASDFTRSTLEGYPGALKKTVVIPYGTPAPSGVARKLTSKAQPLRVLYVGSLQQRKGMSYLFDAVSLAGSAVTLTLIGRKGGICAELDIHCAQHRWLESVPHREVLAEMSRHDVLVFPSLFEGFGLVIGEALSQGLPVITTANTGGPDILRDGKQGFIVPIRNPEAIAARLLQLHQDRELLLEMSEAARTRAGELSWQAYKDRTVALVREAVAAE